MGVSDLRCPHTARWLVTTKLDSRYCSGVCMVSRVWDLHHGVARYCRPNSLYVQSMLCMYKQGYLVQLAVDRKRSVFLDSVQPPM